MRRLLTPTVLYCLILVDANDELNVHNFVWDNAILVHVDGIIVTESSQTN